LPHGSSNIVRNDRNLEGILARRMTGVGRSEPFADVLSAIGGTRPISASRERRLSGTPIHAQLQNSKVNANARGTAEAFPRVGFNP
jgi:hypothetical protein